MPIIFVLVTKNIVNGHYFLLEHLLIYTSFILRGNCHLCVPVKTQ